MFVQTGDCFRLSFSISRCIISCMRRHGLPGACTSTRDLFERIFFLHTVDISVMVWKEFRLFYPSPLLLHSDRHPLSTHHTQRAHAKRVFVCRPRALRRWAERIGIQPLDLPIRCVLRYRNIDSYIYRTIFSARRPRKPPALQYAHTRTSPRLRCVSSKRPDGLHTLLDGRCPVLFHAPLVHADGGRARDGPRGANVSVGHRACHQVPTDGPRVVHLLRVPGRPRRRRYVGSTEYGGGGPHFFIST